jgi:hypothetical protein
MSDSCIGPSADNGFATRLLKKSPMTVKTDEAQEEMIGVFMPLRAQKPFHVSLLRLAFR